MGPRGILCAGETDRRDEIMALKQGGMDPDGLEALLRRSWMVCFSNQASRMLYLQNLS